MNEEIAHKFFTLIERYPRLSQRELAERMGISLGRDNYSIKALTEKGWLKACYFKNSDNMIAYAYVLTPIGLSEKAIVASRYLKHKVHEYETVKIEIEIEILRQEVSEASWPSIVNTENRLMIDAPGSSDLVPIAS